MVCRDLPLLWRTWIALPTSPLREVWHSYLFLIQCNRAAKQQLQEFQERMNCKQSYAILIRSWLKTIGWDWRSGFSACPGWWRSIVPIWILVIDVAPRHFLGLAPQAQCMARPHLSSNLTTTTGANALSYSPHRDLLYCVWMSIWMLYFPPSRWSFESLPLSFCWHESCMATSSIVTPLRSRLRSCSLPRKTDKTTTTTSKQVSNTTLLQQNQWYSITFSFHYSLALKLLKGTIIVHSAPFQPLVVWFQSGHMRFSCRT
jgi:hypothetical protein